MLSAYMDLNLTPTELAFRDQVRGWLHDNVPADWEKRRAEDEMTARFEFLRAWQKQVFHPFFHFVGELLGKLASDHFDELGRLLVQMAVSVVRHDPV